MDTAKQPAATRPQLPEGYGLPDSTEGLLGWGEVESGLRDALHYWINSVRPDGRPHSVPRWGVWIDGRFWYDGAPTTRHTRNVEKNPAVTLTLESGTQVVIVEGESHATRAEPSRTTWVRNFLRPSASTRTLTTLPARTPGRAGTAVACASSHRIARWRGSPSHGTAPASPSRPDVPPDATSGSARAGWVPGGSAQRPAVFFDGADAFCAWLEEHHESEPQLWMGLRKKHVEGRGLTWGDAVPVALCFGWIDSVSQPIDDDSRRQRWTPRRQGSNWSATNITHVERLLDAGLMRPAGIAAYEARTQERTAVYSYEGEEIALSPEQLTHVEGNRAAWAFWQAATPSYRRVAARWVTSAKREVTRESRLSQLVADSASGLLIPPQRYGPAPAWRQRAAGAAADASG